MTSEEIKITRVDDYLWEIPRQGGMRVPGRIYATEKLFAALKDDNCLRQVMNVAYLPGIVGYSLAMPDIHWGYGFPIGGVAAMDFDEGVISPGGVGYDINCGVRLVKTSLAFKDVREKIPQIVEALFSLIPSGVGAEGAIPKLSKENEKRLLRDGARWAVEHGYGRAEDLEYMEEGGRLESADPELLSDRALERGLKQVGTLGSGNHFLEIGKVEEIYLPEIANSLGIFSDQLVVLIHTGSRGLGYQTCEDFLKVMNQAMAEYDIQLPDRQLACTPINSPEGQDYLGAMAAAANYAWVNRQVIMSLAEKAFLKALNTNPAELGFSLIYDVCHNIAKIEDHVVDGQKRRLCVHRKGATRAFPPGHAQIPEAYQKTGQPILIPGDMGRYSYLLVGTEAAMEKTFGSTCHGAGRVMSRTQSKKQSLGINIDQEMARRGVVARYRGRGTMAEEMPHAYKDVADVVETMDLAGISRKVARFRPVGVIKG
ncbi:MAG: RNA-splicing ligase RtcB [Deltaproteobacteria bacterium RIFCSPLOWO2_12_FULL_60_19]|nr:MAG: RNA-splicing ligase RtcB [Deltaproteobacteria bacterium RIFCSPLOWO2_12_FULL_60_19]